jgi:hypothetical protein
VSRHDSRIPGTWPLPRQPAVHGRRVIGREHGKLLLAVPRPLPNLGHREAVAFAARADPLPLCGAGAVGAHADASEPRPAPAMAVAVPPVDGHLEARLGEDVLVGAHGVAPPGVQAAAARLAGLPGHNAGAGAGADGARRRPGQVLELAEAHGEHGVLVLPHAFLVEQRGSVGAERAPAQRARGVGEQPGVDAADVERVPAQRQQPQPVLAGELAQADRAVERLLGAGAGADHLPVQEHRERVDDVLVQPGVVQVEQLLQLPLQRGLLPAAARRVRPTAGTGLGPRARTGTGTAAPEQEPDQEMQQAGDEQHHGRYHHGEQHGGANLGTKTMTAPGGRRPAAVLLLGFPGDGEDAAARG